MESEYGRFLKQSDQGPDLVMENAKNLHFPGSGQEQERFKPIYYLRQVDVKELQAMAESGEFGGVGDPYGGQHEVCKHK